MSVILGELEPLKVEVMAAGQIVPAFEVLDAANKKVIDGFHSIP